MTEINLEKIDKSLNVFLGIIKLGTILGMVFGFIVIYKYLDYINQLGIFTSIVSQPYSVLAILFVFGFISSFIYLSLLAPYQLTVIANDEGVLIKRLMERLVFLVSSIFPIIGFLILIVIAFYTSKEWRDSNCGEVAVFGIFIFSIFLPAVVFLISWHYSKKRIVKKNRMIKELKGIYSTNSLKNIVLFSILVALLTFFLLLVVVLSIAANWIDDENFQWLFLICSLILVAANSLVAAALLNDNKNKINDNKNKITNKIVYYGFPILFCLVYWVSIAFFTDDIPQKLLYPIRFIEIPKDSGWYIISNKYQRKEDFELHGIGVNGMTTEGMECIKKNFTREVPFEGIDFDDEKNKCAQPKNKLQKNALYGYMAWNLGEVKVFCPKSVEFYGKHTEEELLLASQKCLVLTADVLQPLDRQYIPY